MTFTTDAGASSGNPRPKEPEHANEFQQIQTKYNDVFALECYKALKKYLMLIGVDPYVDNFGSKIRLHVVNLSMIIGVIPMIIELCVAIRNRDFDGTIEELPHVLTMVVSMTKFVNVWVNKKHFKILLDFIADDWKTLKNEIHELDKVTKQGNRIANLYRSTLLSFLVVFLFIPLIPPTLDIIMPLNETRPRQLLFNVNYVFIEVEDYFFSIYLHLSWTSIISVLLIVTVDSLYMLIIHHSSGLFDVCGYQVEMATADNLNETMLENNRFKQFKRCIITHHRSLQFFNTLQKCSQNMNLLQVGLNMILISLTAVQIILYMDRPAEVMRFVIFLVAQQFHLFFISLFGQILWNHSLSLREKIYNSRWYEMPVKFQKTLYMMQIRCIKPCLLSAAGLYDMNIENFGVTVKACMSYFTMFLSFRE